ncbi:methyl-accepting chemotaxis protein [Colwelliaceae bacterium 6441]
MLKVDSIQKKILYTISTFAIIAVFLRTAIFANSDYETAKNNVHQQIITQLQGDTLKITSFFSQYARVTDTFINSPEVLDWMVNHKERGSLTGTEEGYHGLNRVLHAVSDRDENILSAFYASEFTQEYLAEDRVTGVPDEGKEFDVEKGYFVRKRPWYQKVIDYKDMLTTAPAVDIITGGISVSLEQVMYVNGELIGAGGIDISLNNIARLSSAINFKGEGFAALFDDQWQNVTFPNDVIKRDINTPIEEYDQISNNQGFSKLTQINSKTFTTVTINGKNYYAVSMPVSTEMPKMTWHIVLFVPAHVIDDPAQSAVFAQITSSLVMLFITLIVLIVITSIISKPLAKLTQAFSSVAEGDSDLTIELDVTSSDETGKLAGYFNTFLQKLRRVITGVAADKEQVSNVSRHIEEITQKLIDKTQQDKQGLDTASVAATELSASAAEIEQNATRTSSAANEMRNKTESTITIAKSASEHMDVLGERISAVNQIIKELESASSNIGQVIEVINSIADQTNLLALNAAIEAARAGEHGRGFSVVADEVRGLASRTQESTKEISTVIEDLQSKILEAGDGMTQGMEQTERVNQEITSSGDSMNEIGTLLDTIQDDMSQVATACVQQTKAIHEISETMNEVNLSADEGAHMINTLGEQANELHSAVNGLDNQLKQFTY